MTAADDAKPVLSPDGTQVWDGTQWQPAQTGGRNTGDAIEAQPAKAPSPIAPGSHIRSRRTLVVGGAALVVILGATGILVLGRGGTGGNPSQATVTASTAPAETPNEVCAREAYDAAADMLNNGGNPGDDGYNREQAIGGLNDPVFRIADDLMISYMTTEVASGKNVASTQMSASARTECAQRDNPNQDSEGGPSGYTP